MFVFKNNGPKPSIRTIAARRAMTLVELLAASALAASLMAATLGVIGNLNKQRRILFAEGSVEPWRRQLAEQVRWDFANARKMCSRVGELRLVGYGGVDFLTDEPTHRPTEIVYSIQEECGRRWLLRKEIHLDAGSLHNSRTELVAAGAVGLAAYNPEQGAEKPPSREPTRESPNAAGLYRSPQSAAGSHPWRRREKTNPRRTNDSALKNRTCDDLDWGTVPIFVRRKWDCPLLKCVNNRTCNDPVRETAMCS